MYVRLNLIHATVDMILPRLNERLENRRVSPSVLQPPPPLHHRRC
jgi:hypothetical protein